MPINPTYPGVYVQEIPSSVRTIVGVSTSVAAFVDYFRYGPMDKAVQIFNMGDFEREFGGLDLKSEASYAIQQFFLNGGSEAWVVRTASKTGDHPLEKADVIILDDIKGKPALNVRAISQGEWGNNLQVKIAYNPTGSGLFDMKISEYISIKGKKSLSRSEVFLNLSMDSENPRYVDKVINDKNSGSKLVTTTVGTTSNALPLQNGTVSGKLPNPFKLKNPNPAISVKIGDDGPVEASLGIEDKNQSDFTIQEVRSLLEKAIRSSKPDNPAFAAATVEVSQDCLHIVAGPTKDASYTIVFDEASKDKDTVHELKLHLKENAKANVQEYKLGNAAIPETAQGEGKKGGGGTLPDGNALVGVLSEKTGMYALEDVDLFNILCIPRISSIYSEESNPLGVKPEEANMVMNAAINYCELRRAVFLVDTPNNINDPQKIKDWLDASNIRHKNAALYFPHIKIADPLDEFRLRSFGASGTIAGLYARTDSARGVWKAPAGTEAKLVNVQALDYTLTDGQNGTLNPLAINCLRNFPVYGNVCWGARTLEGADQQTSEWKYVPVRRLALFLEESLFRGTQWVVFEPNDESLWAQIRLNIGAFMHSLFRQGAFQGQTPKDAYFVKCDKETTTQDDINKGIVNIVVGFAPLKPAEFVIIQIQQMAGQIQT